MGSPRSASATNTTILLATFLVDERGFDVVCAARARGRGTLRGRPRRLRRRPQAYAGYGPPRMTDTNDDRCWAALGAAVDAIGGDAGKSAGAGPVLGGVHGRRRTIAAQHQRQYAAQNSYDRAFAACMEGG